MLGADLGVAADGTRSSRRLTPVAMAMGAAIRDPARLGGIEARFMGSVKTKMKLTFLFKLFINHNYSGYI